MTFDDLAEINALTARYHRVLKQEGATKPWDVSTLTHLKDARQTLARQLRDKGVEV